MIFTVGRSKYIKFTVMEGLRLRIQLEVILRKRGNYSLDNSASI